MPDVRVQRLGDEFQINGDAHWRSAMDTDLVARAGGGFTTALTWLDQFGGVQGARARSFSSNGTPLGDEFSPINWAYHMSVSLAALPNGGVLFESDADIAIQSNHPTYGTYVEYSYSSADSLVSSTAFNEFEILAYAGAPRATALASGAHVVVWPHYGFGSAPYLAAQLFDASGTRVNDPFPVASGFAGPSLAPLSDGGFIFAWAAHGSIFAQRYDATATARGGVFAVNEPTASAQSDVRVAELLSGGFVAVWASETPDPGDDIKAQLFDAAGDKVGQEFVVGASFESAQSHARVATLPAGGFVIVWMDQAPGASSDIRAQVYAEDGTPIGDEFLVTNPSSLDETLPSVAGLADGSIVFAWTEPFVYPISSPYLGQRFTWVTDYAGTAADDTLGGSLGNDTFTPGAGVDFVRGFSGHDMVDYSALSHAMEINLAAGWSWDGSSMDFLREIEDATGSSGNDTLTGTAGDNILDGGPGGTDFINGGDGLDTVSYASSTRAVAIHLDQQSSWDGATMDFLSSIENAVGSRFDDYIVGTVRDNVLDGGAGGTDHLIGGFGFDTVSYQHATAAMQIYLDNQVTWDGVTVDFLSSIERGVGSAFNDTLAAAASGSTLDGWVGNDNLFGGAGADIFEFETLGKRLDLGADQIFGFQHGTDKIAIGNDVGFLHAFADIAAHAVQSGSDTLIQINDQSSIRLVGVNLADLTASDFQFVG